MPCPLQTGLLFIFFIYFLITQIINFHIIQFILI